MKARLVLLTTLCLLMAASATLAETVAGLPLHIKTLADGVIRVWIGDHISSTATTALATEKGVVVIDTTGLPGVDRQLRDIIARELGRDDFVMLINTHEHRDHTGGNAVYADCEIVGHELVAEGMRGNSDNSERVAGWLTTRLAEQEAELESLAPNAPEKARLREDLMLNRMELEAAQAGLESVPPTKTFSDRMVLDQGDTTFELYYVGGMHSASDIAVLVPEHGLLMTGDTMSDKWLTDTPGCLAAFAVRPGIHHDFPLLIENWHRLLARKDDIRTLHTGHWNGELSFAGFEARVGYIETLWEAVNRMAGEDGTLEGFLAAYRLEESFPDLAESPGFSQRNHFMTMSELWRVASGQASAAEALYALIDEGAAEAEIQAVVAGREAARSGHYFMEAEFNARGYNFLRQDKVAQATTLFEITVDLYPDSWNAYDSLGEALMTAGDREAAIAMYEKSMELNPDNTNGRDMLVRLREEASVN